MAGYSCPRCGATSTSAANCNCGTRIPRQAPVDAKALAAAKQVAHAATKAAKR